MIDREFRVGDRVTCNIYGAGIINSINSDFYCVDVYFEQDINVQYTKEGLFDIYAKRTLFILPQQKPTKQQIKEKFKQLLDEIEEVEFTNDTENYNVILGYGHESKKYFCDIDCNNLFEYFTAKFINKSDAERIVGEMNKFIKGE